jgi:hypothetical protein
MSYFAANSVSIDKTRQLFRVKGGDNNVFPRMNYWSPWHPLRTLLAELSGGNIQFTTRGERAVQVDYLAREAGAKLTEVTGLSGSTLSRILSGEDRAALAASWRKEIDDWHGGLGSHMFPEYVAQRVTELEQLLAILAGPGTLAVVDAVLAEFCERACQPVRRDTHLVSNGYAYVLRTYRGGANTTTDRTRAKRFSEAKAREVATRFSGYEAQEAAT